MTKIQRQVDAQTGLTWERSKHAGVDKCEGMSASPKPSPGVLTCKLRRTMTVKTDTR